MINSLSKSEVQTLLRGHIIASAISLPLRKQFDLTQLEQSILMLIDLYQEQGLRITGAIITRSKLAHLRSTQEAVRSLVEKGFIEKQKVEGRLGLQILLTEKGQAFRSRTYSLVRQQYKILSVAD